MIDRTEAIVLAVLILFSFGVAHTVHGQISAIVDAQLMEFR